MRLLIDMNLSPAWAGLLESQDIVAIHWADVGAPQASDREIVEFARANDMVILTSDLDFSAILAATSGENPASFSCEPRTSTSRRSAAESLRPYGRRSENLRTARS